MTIASDFTERESQIVELVTGRFPDRSLDARIVSVRTLDDTEVPTLRLTLDDAISTDFARERVAGIESVEALAAEAVEELEHPAQPIGHDDCRRQDIAERAYALYEARGGEHGRDEEDWYTAERNYAEETIERDAHTAPEIPPK